jgi:phage baseplate assembly protein W
MPQYIGFSTVNANKPRTTNPPPGNNGGPGSITDPIIPGRKYRVTDAPLVIRDFLNAINIRQGQKVGQPQYGSKIWDFVFDPNTRDTQAALETEVRRIIGLDPRLQIGYIRVYPQENGIMVEMQLAVFPFNQAQVLNVFFNSRTSKASVTK